MPERVTAQAQLARILDLLPRTARAEGASLEELSRALNVDPSEIVRDLTEVYTRAFYQPAGTGDDVQILIEGDHVTVWTTGEFRRPPRLSPRESLALGLGLRVLAAARGAPDDEALTSLAERLEGRLLDPRGGDDSAAFAVDPSAVGGGDTHRLLASAARDRRRCRIEYLKPRGAAPHAREIDPYVLLETAGLWYLVGFCHASVGMRAFRLDRILEAAELGATFEVPEDFDPFDYVSDGRVYRGEEFRTVTVRYSARIARWIREQGAVEPAEDGSVLVRYPVTDPAWIVRHVLEHGPDAEVLDPADVRAEVAEAVRSILDPD